ncbi:hypothetical protein FQA39_LY16059 [Lamprigera yunnana]|nr:hypothetical protein FQA39_LY16059 [Lamprigera yunnana]
MANNPEIVRSENRSVLRDCYYQETAQLSLVFVDWHSWYLPCKRTPQTEMTSLEVVLWYQSVNIANIISWIKPYRELTLGSEKVFCKPYGKSNSTNLVAQSATIESPTIDPSGIQNLAHDMNVCTQLTIYFPDDQQSAPGSAIILSRNKRSHGRDINEAVLMIDQPSTSSLIPVLTRIDQPQHPVSINQALSREHYWGHNQYSLDQPSEEKNYPL